jgi:signal transduction histidine kinase
MIQAQLDDQRLLDDLETVEQTTHDLATLSDKVAKLEQLLSQDIGTGQTIQIRSIVEQIFERTESERDVDFEYEGRDEIEVVATREQLQVALDNLITNAVKHNDSVMPEVTVRVARHVDSGPPLEITVRDNGPGIPEQERKAMTVGEETPLVHSSGIGLWTVHWIARTLGWNLSVESNDPSGAMVTLLIPTQSTELNDEQTSVQEGLMRENQ